MRVSTLVPVCLVAGILCVCTAGAAPAPNGHTVTVANSRASRSYADGLREYHLGRLEPALEKLQDAAKRDPGFAMAQWALSRALRKAGKNAEALAAAAKAEELGRDADDRERRMIAAWSKHLKAEGQPEAERAKGQSQVRSDLDLALCLYHDDPELWLLRGDVEQNPLRAVPFYLTALRIQPTHSFATAWSPKAPPAPEVTPAQPMGATREQPAGAKPAEAEAPQLFEGLGKLSHPIATSNPKAQAYYEQGLRCYHAYVTPMSVKNSAARCFQYAVTLDPECAMAYWGLSLAAGPRDPMTPHAAANRALELAVKKGNDRERRFAAARVLELSGPSKRDQFLDALDGAIAAYPDDVELWIWRGKALGVGQAAIPYQLAAHRMQPEHPSPNHEMVHGYEAIDRPALGFPFTIGFRNSAPNMPHAHHMQAHLAMRIGRWQEAIDCTRASRRKSLEGFPELDPNHHIDILMRALAHEGRFAEADAEPRAYRDGIPWARLLQLKAKPDELAAWAERRQKTNSPDGIYIGALVALDRGDMDALAPLMQKVEEQFKKQPGNIYRFNEVKGRFLVQTGQTDEGLKLLREAAQRAVKDSGLHAWGGGSYVLEVWGEAALRARRWDEAEEAYHEALAHEHGSILGALGMQVVWEQRGRSDMAEHYANRARSIWKDADAGSLERQLERLRKLATGSVAVAGKGNDTNAR